jgi:hypothetical protein
MSISNSFQILISKPTRKELKWLDYLIAHALPPIGTDPKVAKSYNISLENCSVHPNHMAMHRTIRTD